ncbi:MAG: bifunctional phosphopantothenoylcysteine decarboxylase/phosphopantothenate--cysteine ligase CoaBC [Christensenellaceae bacterium]|jgi:phosphopantothenoylcysteine decarboxylase/phosphopantothenate--cysteine ligase
MIKGKHIVVGVTGGIAAYKAAALVSGLKKAGAEVRVCMTENACQFVAPLTFETLSAAPVVTDTFTRERPYEVEHVSLGKWADMIVVAPATANIIAKAAQGIADDFLSTLLLAARAEVMFAPAMNTAMLHHPATEANMQTLGARGVYFIAPGTGMLACGDMGDGRMAEPEEIIAVIKHYFTAKNDFAGKRILVTAGPTRERIDDVRFLSNRSSGKMGYEMARAAARRGAEVTLISGPVDLVAPAGVTVVPVESAQEMYEACMARFDEMDIVIKAAAVADYTPEVKLDGKMKKAEDFSLSLIRTADILRDMGEKKTHQILVGFAAETADLEKYAQEKVVKKNLDMIAANDVSRQDIGFGADENQMILYLKDGTKIELEKTTKAGIANRILDEIKKIKA